MHPDQLSVSFATLPPDDEAVLLNYNFVGLLQQLPPQAGLLLQGWLFSSRSVVDLARELNLTLESADKVLTSIQTRFIALRDLRQPPHAAD